jgi:hypothetical protein
MVNASSAAGPDATAKGALSPGLTLSPAARVAVKTTPPPAFIRHAVELHPAGAGGDRPGERPSQAAGAGLRLTLTDVDAPTLVAAPPASCAVTTTGKLAPAVENAAFMRGDREPARDRHPAHGISRRLPVRVGETST